MTRCSSMAFVLVLAAFACTGCGSSPTELGAAEEEALKAEMARVEAIERNHHQLNAVPEGGMRHSGDGENPDE